MAQFFNKAIKFLHLDKLFISNNKDIKELNKMITPKQTLKNPYYFIRNEIIYNISFNQDKDKCGQQLVDESEVVNKSRFPNFTVNYTDENSEQLNVIYWLQDMIQDGDRYDGSKFIQDENHGDGDYIATFQNEIKEEVKKLIESGKTIQQIKSTLPHYYFEPSINPQENKKTIVIDGCKKYNVTYNGVEGLELITDDEMLNQVYNVANQHAIECANNVLNDYGLEISKDNLVTKDETGAKNFSLRCNYYITDISSPTKLFNSSAISEFAYIEIDGVKQAEIVSEYTFETNDYHEVKYFLKNPSVIPENTFKDCDKLTDLYVNDEITTIKDYAFKNCVSLEALDGGKNVNYIGPWAFDGCTALGSAQTSKLSYIGIGAFQNCDIYSVGLSDEDSIKLTNSIDTIASSCFGYCTGLTEVELPNSVTNIDMGAFTGCRNLKEIKFGKKLKSIGQDAFAQCSSIEGELMFPDTFEIINKHAFFNCSSITSVILPNSTSYIGESAFFNCSNLQSVTVKATTPPNISNVSPFDNNAYGRKFYVPAASVEAYKTAEGWSQYADDILPIA